MRSLKRYFEINCKTIDGTIETFCDGEVQGYLVKTFYSFNPNADLVLWFFESLTEKNIQVVYSTRDNCEKDNKWINEELLNIKKYPIISDIKRTIISDILKTMQKYYHLDEEIKLEENIKI